MYYIQGQVQCNPLVYPQNGVYYQQHNIQGFQSHPPINTFQMPQTYPAQNYHYIKEPYNMITPQQQALEVSYMYPQQGQVASNYPVYYYQQNISTQPSLYPSESSTTSATISYPQIQQMNIMPVQQNNECRMNNNLNLSKEDTFLQNSAQQQYKMEEVIQNDNLQISQCQKSLYQQQKTQKLDWIIQYLNNPYVQNVLEINKQDVDSTNLKRSLELLLQPVGKLYQFSERIEGKQPEEILKNRNKYLQSKKISKTSLKKKFQNQQEDDYNEENNSLYNKKSKFHNKNKIFMSILLKFFKMNSLVCFNCPATLRQQLYQIVDKCRKSGRLLEGTRIKRSDLFNHAHFNALFLKLNSTTMEIIKKDKQYNDLHNELFDLQISMNKQNDTENEETLPTQILITNPINEQNIESSEDNIKLNFCKTKKQLKTYKDKSSPEYIQYINFLKECLYYLSFTHIKQPINEELEDQDYAEYEIRAFQGIQKMNHGQNVKRF